jgi:peroxiredoxin
MRRLVRSAYFWFILGIVSIVLLAWTGRERYRDAAVLAGSEAPEFSFPSLAHGQVDLSDYEDRVVLVNVWATWCPPCRDELPSMQRLYETFEGEDFEILAVSVDAGIGQVDDNGNVGGDLAAFVGEYGLTFPILHDPRASILRTYQVVALPESFLVAKGGVIFRKVAGETEWDLPVNQELIRRLLDR